MENVYRICGKFIQETTYQVSSQLPKFYRRYYKNILVSFFLDTLYITKDRGTNTNTNYRTTLNKCIHSASSYQISAQSDNPWSYCDITSKTTFNFSTVGHLCKWTLTFPMPLRILMQHIKIISAKSDSLRLSSRWFNKFSRPVFGGHIETTRSRRRVYRTTPTLGRT